MILLWVAIGVAVLAFVLSALATPLAQKVAFHVGWLDVPGRHKAHSQPVPLLGGSAIFLPILGLSLLAIAMVRVWAATDIPSWIPASVAVHIPGAASKASQALGILGGALLLHLLGLIDDRRSLGPWIKLLVQMTVCSLVVIFFDVRILQLLGPTLSILVTIVWLVVITNAFNFLDNMDGLAAGVALICATALLGAAASIGQIFVSAWLCLIIGAVAGFLLYNFPPASIFMGDAGSLVLGYLLGVLSCLTTYVPPDSYHLYDVLAPLVLLAVPLYDAVSVMLLRIRDRANPMVGDRRHFSHRLLKRGMSVRAAVLTIYLCTGATAIAASLLPHVKDIAGASLVFTQTVAVLLIIALLESGDAKR